MALGLRLVRVTINDEGDAECEPRQRGTPPRAESMSMLIAGKLAEARYGVDEQARTQSARYDMTTINEIATALASAPEDVDPPIAFARERATSLVEEHVDDIEWLAFVLREVGGTMPGYAVRSALCRNSRHG